MHERLETLTPREREVLACVVTGMLNKQIADALGMSEKTVKVHRGRIMQKMHAISLVELVRMADKVGIQSTGPCCTRLMRSTLRWPCGLGPVSPHLVWYWTKVLLL